MLSEKKLYLTYSDKIQKFFFELIGFSPKLYSLFKKYRNEEEIDLVGYGYIDINWKCLYFTFEYYLAFIKENFYFWNVLRQGPSKEFLEEGILYILKKIEGRGGYNIVEQKQLYEYILSKANINLEIFPSSPMFIEQFTHNIKAVYEANISDLKHLENKLRDYLKNEM